MTSVSPVRVGLVGAGPWADQVHAPMLSAGPETQLVGVWTRRPEAAQRLAERWGVKAFPSFPALVEASEGIAFAVPPAVQAELATQAAYAGRALLLEKPIADSLCNAEALVRVVEETGVATVVTLTYRFASRVRSFIAEARKHTFRGGRSLFLTNAYLGGPFATPWRLEGGSVLDIGPHAIDLLQATVGPVTAVTGSHGTQAWSALTLEHDSGAVTQVSLCSHVAVDPLRIEIELFNHELTRNLNVTAAMGPAFGEAILGAARPLADAEAFAALRAEFATSVRTGAAHELDSHYGLRLQRVVAAAVESIENGRRVEVP